MYEVDIFDNFAGQSDVEDNDEEEQVNAQPADVVNAKQADVVKQADEVKQADVVNAEPDAEPKEGQGKEKGKEKSSEPTVIDLSVDTSVGKPSIIEPITPGDSPSIITSPEPLRVHITDLINMPQEGQMSLVKSPLDYFNDPSNSVIRQGLEQFISGIIQKDMLFDGMKMRVDEMTHREAEAQRKLFEESTVHKRKLEELESERRLVLDTLSSKDIEKQKKKKIMDAHCDELLHDQQNFVDKIIKIKDML